MSNRLFDDAGNFLTRFAVIVEGRYVVDVTTRGSVEIEKDSAVTKLKGSP